MRTNVTVSVVVGVVSLAGGVFAADAVPEDVPRRVSFAISGGASKGAYEAGLNWAMVSVFGQLESIDSVLGGRYRSFEAASFAGASAGGINTLLGSLTWCMLPEADGGPVNRIDDNIFRDVWLLPDVNSLLPPEPDSPKYLPDDALLARADFLGAAEGLRELWGSPAFEPGCRIPLGVTVTRNEPEALQLGDVEVRNQRFYVPFELEVTPDRSVEFSFDPDDYPTVTDPAMILVPRSPDQTPFNIADEDVIDLALTTSAFPGGFGRRRLSYCRLEQFVPGGGREPDSGGQQPSLICPEGYVLSEAIFSDGGLFDNLPIGLARMLAERHVKARTNTFPVDYVYLEPNRLRYEEPKPVDPRACDLPDPPEACADLAYNLSSEAGMLFGALGTARTFELYRELASGSWSMNLAELAIETGKSIEAADPALDCRQELPFFEGVLSCPEALHRAGNLLKLVYAYRETPIAPPFSVDRLLEAGIASRCEASPGAGQADAAAVCTLEPAVYRRALASGLRDILAKADLEDDDLARQVSSSEFSMHNDRRLHITSRGAPITGTLLGSFGAFLDFEFREYDYYVGVYDAVMMFSDSHCGAHFVAGEKTSDYDRCVDEVAVTAYRRLGIGDNPRARYVFALMAQRNLQDRGLLRFAYEPMPEADRSMSIIYEGLERTLEAGRPSSDPAESSVSVEEEFFTTLRDQGFVPTPNPNGSEPLLAQIMEDPEYWSAVLIQRATSRLVYLEQQAEALYEAQEPDPDKRAKANTTLMGAAAYALQSATYTYPAFTFAPSVAPRDWGWRNAIPYEVAFDFASNNLTLAWRPTIALNRDSNLGFRLGLGISRGFIGDGDSEEDDSHLTFGFDYTRLKLGNSAVSWGVTPAYFHTFDEAAVERQDSVGFDVHAGFLKNRFCIRAGARDVNDFGDTWFVLFGFADVPGAVYWLTR